MSDLTYQTPGELRAIQESMDVLSGKWKIAIISSICDYNKGRFSDILNDVAGISNNMLGKELKEQEINQLVKRTVLDTQPVSVLYELTEHGQTLKTSIYNLTKWGMAHHRKIIGPWPARAVRSRSGLVWETDCWASQPPGPVIFTESALFLNPGRGKGVSS